MAIVTFSDPAIEILFIYGKTRKGLGWASFARIIRRKLEMIHFAARLNDLNHRLVTVWKRSAGT